VKRWRLLCPLAASLLIAGSGSASGGGFSGPVAITAGYGSVWVGLGTGEVVELDERTSRVRARWFRGRSATGFVHGLARAARAIWVAESDRLLRIDARSRSVHAIAGTRHAFTISADADGVWTVGDPNRITRVDPRRSRIVASIRVPGRAWGVATGPAGVFVSWVPTQGAVSGPGGKRLFRRLDPDTNRPTGSTLRLGCDQAVAVGRSAVWTSDQCSGELVRRHPRTLRSTGSIQALSHQRPVLAFGSVWLTGRGRVVRIEPGTLRIVASIRVRASALAAGARAIWALDVGSGRSGFLRRIDPSTNTLAGRPVHIAP
jgi:hypothetical protein